MALVVKEHREEDNDYIICEWHYRIKPDLAGGPYFQFRIQDYINCCGIREVGQIVCSAEALTDEYFEKFAAILKEHAERWDYCFAHLTIIKDEWDHRKWDELLTKHFPGRVRSRWRTNPNSGNELRFYVLPV